MFISFTKRISHFWKKITVENENWSDIFVYTMSFVNCFAYNCIKLVKKNSRAFFKMSSSVNTSLNTENRSWKPLNFDKILEFVQPWKNLGSPQNMINIVDLVVPLTIWKTFTLLILRNTVNGCIVIIFNDFFLVLRDVNTVIER